MTLKIFKPFRYYEKEEIEQIANNLLKKMAEHPKYKPVYPLDSSRVADFLKLAVIWDKIPSDEEGLIAARILPIQRLIEVNEAILNLPEGFESSTIAHEIGHWILHIDQNKVNHFSKKLEQGIKISIQPFLCRNINSQQGIEWQAQYFASCLLMPVHILDKKRQMYDLTNWNDLYKMKNEFGVTISNLTNRLKNLGWIHLVPDSRQILLAEAIPPRK